MTRNSHFAPRRWDDASPEGLARFDLQRCEEKQGFLAGAGRDAGIASAMERDRNGPRGPGSSGGVSGSTSFVAVMEAADLRNGNACVSRLTTARFCETTNQRGSEVWPAIRHFIRNTPMQQHVKSPQAEHRPASRRTAIPAPVLLSLLHNHTFEAPLRIWVPGCATGEEVYSIAICLREILEETGSMVPVQMSGTDLSAEAIAVARTGLCDQRVQGHVSPERLRRFFRKTDDGWQITREVRDLCIFSRQNLVKDPPFSNLDLISCRNVLTYMQPVPGRLKARFPIRHVVEPSARESDQLQPAPEPAFDKTSPADASKQLSSSEIAQLNEELFLTADYLDAIAEQQKAAAATRSELTNLKQLLEDSQIPILILDQDLSIRRFAGPDVSPSIRGMQVPQLRELALKTIAERRPSQGEVQDTEGHRYSITARPCAEGAVLTLIARPA